MSYFETFASLVVTFRLIEGLPKAGLEKCQVYVNGEAVPVTVEKLKPSKNRLQTHRVRYDDPDGTPKVWDLGKDTSQSVATALAKDHYIGINKDLKKERNQWELASRPKPTLVKGKGID